MKILLAVDGSACTQRMLAFLAARHHFLDNHDEYTVLTVTPPPAAGMSADAGRPARQRSEADAIIAAVRDDLAPLRRTVYYRVEAGAPADMIAETAEIGHFDLVVMGSHGQSALPTPVLGSVATEVLARCRTPVLLIH